jgi:8-oxo-dGTP pyrophosphatase MutT (NUDIX family)
VEQRLRQALADRRVCRISDRSLALSAVLVPLYCKQGEHYLVFTRRTERVKVHKGQISFPGGAYQDGDEGLLDTALRESAEELGLAPDGIEILGALDDIITESGYIISPFVALIPWPHEFKVNREEIEEVIEVPVSALLDKSFREPTTETIDGRPLAGYFYHYRGRVIWGATAKILHQFLGIFARARNPV